MSVCGIDYGTTRTKSSILDASGKPSAILNERGEPTTPSVVYYAQSGPPLVGRDAEEQSLLEPGRCVRYPKLELGTTDNLLREGGTVNATDAVAAQLAVVKADIERQTNEELKLCVATLPANFKDDGKRAYLDAYESIGVEVLKLVAEPTAVAMCYTIQGRFQGRMIVYDFGGGTFDCSILDVDGDQATVLATHGVRALGGNDITGRIERRVLEEIQSQTGITPTPESHPLLFIDIHERSEQAKFSLARRDRVPIVLAVDGQQVVVTIERASFHKDIDPLVRQSFDAMDEAVKGAGLTYEEIDRLILAGGTTRMPYIQERVADHTGLFPKADVDPEHAVAHGAAIECASELARVGKTVSLNGLAIPDPGIISRDVTAHAVGCCVVDRTSKKERLFNSVIIPKNTPIPCRRVDRFFLQHDHQKIAQIEILQGDPGAERDDCLLIGELELKDLPQEKKRSQRIQVEYHVDRNAMVTVTGTDLVSGKEATVCVDYKKGIKPKDKLKTA